MVGKDTAESAADRILGLPEAARVLIGFPVPLGGTPLADLLDRLQKRGFQRLLVDGEAAPLSSYAGNGHAVDPLVVGGLPLLRNVSGAQFPEVPRM